MPDNKLSNFQDKSADTGAAGASPASDPPASPGRFSLRRRLFNAWTGKSQTNLHLSLAALFLLMFLLGKLLATSGVSSEITGLMQTIGTSGIFCLLLTAFLHQNLHGSRDFLERFRDADHLPAKQLGEVSFFCMFLLLAAGALLMLGGAWLIPFLWSVLTRLFHRKPVDLSMDLSDIAIRPPESENTEPAVLTDAIRPTPAWATLLERLLFLFGTVVIILLLLAALLTASRKLYHVLTRKRQWDDDERIRLTPTLLKLTPSSQTSAAPRFHLPGGEAPDEKIRKYYRRIIRIGLRHRKKTPDAWAAPGELEASAGIRDPVLHDLYEKARYSPVSCTREDLETLQARKP